VFSFDVKIVAYFTLLEKYAKLLVKDIPERNAGGDVTER
jgi:hypothetical protein